MRIPSGKTDQLIFFVAVDATDLKTRETGLSSFTVYRSRNGGTATAYTTPTVTELSAANMPGVYALTVDEDTTIASSSDSEEYCVHITQAAMAPVTRTIELYRRDTTSGNTASVDSNGRVDVIKVAGTTQTARDIGASVLLSAGTGTGQLDFTSGVVKANLAQILGTALTETAGQIAAAFKKFFDKASPTGTINSIPDAVAGTNGGLFIAGTNAATTITTSLSTTFTGDLTGSVGSVTGAVGSVTGNVGGNVGGSVASVTADVGITQTGADKVWATATRALTDKAGFALSSAGVQAIWDALTSVLTTVGSIGKLLVDNINATISSRLASASYTAPLDAAGTRSAVGLASANLDTQLTAIDDYIDTEVAAIKAVTDQLVAAQSEPTGVPAANATPLAKIAWIAALARNKITQTATTQTLRNDADSGNIATSTQSDDGTTHTRGEWV